MEVPCEPVSIRACILGLANFIRDEFYKIFEPRMNEVASLMEEQINRCREANIDVHVSNSYHDSARIKLTQIRKSCSLVVMVTTELYKTTWKAD